MGEEIMRHPEIPAKFHRFAFYYCILPNGNAPEFPELNAELLRRGIAAHYSDTGGSGARIYRIHRRDIHKLPSDGRGPYLGDDESGHGIYHLNKEALKALTTINPIYHFDYNWKSV